MANIKECIYFFLYKENEQTDGVYNCTDGFDATSFTNKYRIGIKDVKSEKVRQVFIDRSVMAYKYDPSTETLLTEYIDEKLAELKKQVNSSGGIVYRDDVTVTRIVENLGSERYYVSSALSSSYFAYSNRYPITIRDGYVVTPNQKMPLVEQSSVFKNDLDVKFVTDHKKEFFELLKALFVARNNSGSLYIEINEKQYEEGRRYLENLLKFLPRVLANKISFSTIYTGDNEDISLFFDIQEEEVRSHNSSYSSSVIVKLANEELVTDGSYCSSESYSGLLDFADKSHFDDSVLKQMLSELSTKIRDVDVSDIDEVYKLLLSFSHLYDSKTIYTDVAGEISKELEYIAETYHLTKETLHVDSNLLFSRLIELVKKMLPLADAFPKKLLEELIIARYKYSVQALDEYIYDLILCKNVDKANANYALADLMFDVTLLSEEVSKYREEYFNNRFLQEDFAAIKEFVSRYLKDSIYSQGLLNLLLERIADDVLLNANKARSNTLLKLVDESLDGGFKSSFDFTISISDSNTLSNVISFYLEYILKIEELEQKNLYFDYIYESLKDSYPFTLLYTQLVTLQLKEQRTTYFLRSMNQSAPIEDEEALFKSVKRFVFLLSGIQNEVVKRCLYIDYTDSYIKSLDLELLTNLDIRYFADSEVNLYESLNEVGKHIEDMKFKANFLKILEDKHKQYLDAKDAEEENKNLISTRIDFVVDNFVSLGDKKMMKIISKYVDRAVLQEAFKDVEIRQDNPEFIYVIRNVATEFLSSDVNSSEKIKFANDVRDAFEDNKLTTKMSFKDFSSMVVGYIILLVILLALDVGASLLIYYLVLKNSFVFLLGAVSLLNVLAMTILYIKNQRQRMFRNPFVRTLWQCFVITVIMFATLYGAITLLMMI